MNIIFILLPFSVLLGFLFLGAYLWSVKSGQYDDLDTPGIRVLADDLKYEEKKGGKDRVY